MCREPCVCGSRLQSARWATSTSGELRAEGLARTCACVETEPRGPRRCQLGRLCGSCRQTRAKENTFVPTVSKFYTERVDR